MLNIPTKFEGILKKLKFLWNLGPFSNFDLRTIIYTFMVLKCMTFTRKQVLVGKLNGLAMVKIYSAYYCTSFMYNLADPICFFHFSSSSVSFTQVHSVYGIESTYIRAFESLLHCLFCLHMASFFFPSSDIWHQSSDFFYLHILPFLTVTVLSILVAYAKSLSYSYLYIFIIFINLDKWSWNNQLYGPEIYGNEFKWSDPHSQELVFAIKGVGFSNGYLGVNNENVYSNHTFC